MAIDPVVAERLLTAMADQDPKYFDIEQRRDINFVQCIFCSFRDANYDKVIGRLDHDVDCIWKLANEELGR